MHVSMEYVAPRILFYFILLLLFFHGETNALLHFSGAFVAYHLLLIFPLRYGSKFRHGNHKGFENFSGLGFLS